MRELGQCMGLRGSSWVMCVPHAQPVFHPCCWPPFRDDLISLMVAPTLMGVTLPEIAVVPLFSFICSSVLFVIRAEVSLLVLHIGF